MHFVLVVAAQRCGNAKRAWRRRRGCREEFSFLREGTGALEWVLPEIGARALQSVAAPAASGGPSPPLENPGAMTESRSGPYPYPQQVSKVNSLWCDGTMWVREVGKPDP